MPRAKPIPSLRNRLRVATTQAILTAAEETLAERGLAASSIAEIAARAGVSVGTLYNHFQDREALLAGLMDERGRELLTRLDEVGASPSKVAFRELLSAFAGAFLRHCELHRRLFEIMLTENAECAAKSGVIHRKRDMVRQVHERLVRVMKIGAKDGKVARETTLNAFLFLGMLRGALMHMHEAPEALDSVALAEAVTRVFVEGACSGLGHTEAVRVTGRHRS
jgi:AcrR family transcriptional regulator